MAFVGWGSDVKLCILTDPFLIIFRRSSPMTGSRDLPPAAGDGRAQDISARYRIDLFDTDWRTQNDSGRFCDGGGTSSRRHSLRRDGALSLQISSLNARRCHKLPESRQLRPKCGKITKTSLVF